MNATETTTTTTTTAGHAATTSYQSDSTTTPPPSSAASQEHHQQNATATTTTPQQHTSIVLFYRYFLPDDDDNDEGRSSLIQQYPQFYVPKLQQYAKDLCLKLHLKGRILIAAEGINGTVSASSSAVLQQFMNQMEAFDLVRDLGFPVNVDGDGFHPTTKHSERLFQDIDWKLSSTTTHHDSCSSESNNGTSPPAPPILEPFPDLKVSTVKEIISTGGAVSIQDIQTKGGNHLTPQEFHQILSSQQDDIVLIDVRNTFEHAIGHFVQPNGTPAVNPETVVFSSFDATFCAANAEALKNRKVLMYCTGGIRCEKASCMLKQRGVEDVSQLSGGIHRYLETYGETGFFRGKNFVFDQRVAQKPSECRIQNQQPQPLPQSNERSEDVKDIRGDEIVGQCIECSAPFDEICGSRVCTVCRDLVLVCEQCQASLREYHCARHAAWKRCFFSFLEIFTVDELSKQLHELKDIRDTFLPACQHKNVRRTLSRQIEKVSRRIQALETGEAVVDRSAPRRCRTCMETSDICNGRCWGFWKMDAAAASASKGGIKRSASDRSTPLLVQVGDRVEVGPDWNELRLGSKLDVDGNPLRGRVVEVKTWGAGGTELDCVAVCWEKDAEGKQGKRRNSAPDQPLIYRWGVLALNNQRLYDLQLIQSEG